MLKEPKEEKIISFSIKIQNVGKKAIRRYGKYNNAIGG